MALFGWTVLALVFLDELLAMAALGCLRLVHVGSLAARLAAAAAGHARVVPLRLPQGTLRLRRRAAGREGAGLRPRVLGLWPADHHELALALLAFSVLVNGLAMIPAIRELAADPAQQPAA